MFSSYKKEKVAVFDPVNLIPQGAEHEM